MANRQDDACGVVAKFSSNATRPTLLVPVLSDKKYQHVENEEVIGAGNEMF